MQKWLTAVVILALSFVAIGHAQRGRGAGPAEDRHRHHDRSQATASRSRAGGVAWTMSKSRRPGLKFSAMNGGLHATTGPNIIFWDPQQMASGNYTVKATFSVTKPPSHPVAYGLFVGGANLDQDSQKYTYFVIREDGQFLIKKRNGAATTNVAGDWAANPAVTLRAAGVQKNELSIQVANGRVSFMANGKEVASHPGDGG